MTRQPGKTPMADKGDGFDSHAADRDPAADRPVT